MPKGRPAGKVVRQDKPVLFRMSPAQKAALQELAGVLGTGMSGAIDRALEDLARRHGVEWPSAYRLSKFA